jgi:DNA-nicking Smr family endonuclease
LRATVADAPRPKPEAATPHTLRLSALGELGSLRDRLADDARADAARRAAETERQAVELRERQLFAVSVGTVQPLRRTPTALPPPARPPAPPEARQRAKDEAAALQESIAGAVDVESLLETDDGLSFRRPGIGLDVVKKLRRGVWTLQAEIDLHGLRRDAAREAVAAFLHAALRRGTRCVRIVHGKGLGSPGREPVLKSHVKNWLAQRDEVLAFTHAKPEDGGHGALIVLLRPVGTEERRARS